MLSTADIEEILRLGHETRGFEVKGPGSPADLPFLIKVVRAALSMANLRDGGYVAIGIDSGDLAAMLPGLDPVDLAAWLNYDDISSKLAVYSDPPFQFESRSHRLSSGASIALLEVDEFQTVPILCAKGFDQVLRKGGCYVRTQRMPETTEIAKSVEMRELLDLAVQKGLRTFIQTAERAGGTVAPHPAEPPVDSAPLFAAQREGAW